ncbi:lysoplasmalogenase family protein [Sphaerochaeta pleomorpha]|nr:lysoplasmalogenase family protein [Sphaerochaeta pleomorpha]
MNNLLCIYLILCTLHLTFLSEGLPRLSHTTKLLLMPALLAYFLSLQTEGGISTLLVTLALLLGTIGDAFLLNNHKGKLFFAGMGSFFLGHICYGTYLALHYKSGVYLLVAALFLLYPLFRIIKSLQVPPYGVCLGIYATILAVLIALSAGSGSLFCTLGAIAFSFSDYFIAKDTIGEKTYSPTAVMGTYTLAQLLLILGILSIQGVW